MPTPLLHLEFDLPIAAGFDLVGIIVFLIVAGISAMSRRAEGSKNTRPFSSSPTGFPLSQPAPNAGQAAPQMDLAEEMRRFLGEIQEQAKARPPVSSPPQLPRFVPRKQPQRQPPTLPKFTPPAKEEERHLTLSSMEEFPSEETQPVHLTSIREEVTQSMKDVRRDLDAEWDTITTSAQTEQVADAPAAARWDRLLFRSPSQLRQAIALREIFGPPRALEPF